LVADNRIFNRVDFKEPVEYYYRPGDNPSGCLGFDISEGGIRFKTDHFIPLNTDVTLQFMLRSKQMVEMTGRIAWIQKVPHCESYEVGLEFNDTDSTLRSKGELKSFISTHRF